jgi:hypothetical protein
MWEKIQEFYKVVTTKIVEIENLLSGKSGPDKKAAVVDYIINLVDIPYVPDVIETPIKRFAIGWLVDQIVEKLNVLTDWDFANFDTSTTTNMDVIAAIVQEPVAPLLDIINGTPSAITLDSKIAAVTEQLAFVQQASVDAKWDECIAFSLRWEGGANYTGQANGTYEMINKADKGGPTRYGIVKGTLAVAHHQGIVSHNDLDVLTLDEAKLIYKKNYWTKYNWGALDFPVSLCTLDCCINHGGFAWILQRAAKALGQDVVIDGKFGPATHAALKALADADANALATEVCKQRKLYYDAIIAKDLSQEANKKGWYNRVKAMAEAAKVTAPEGL